MRRIASIFIICTLLTTCQIGTARVYFEANGGGNFDYIALDLGVPLKNLPKPTKFGYTFDTWCYDQALTQPVQEGDIPTMGETTIYAKYSLNKETLSQSEVIAFNTTYQSNITLSQYTYRIIEAESSFTTISVNGQGVPITGIQLQDSLGQNIEGKLNATTWVADEPVAKGDYLLTITSFRGDCTITIN